MVKLFLAYGNRRYKTKLSTYDIHDFGWTIDGAVLKPIWTTLAETSEACMALVKYGCQQKFGKALQV